MSRKIHVLIGVIVFLAIQVIISHTVSPLYDKEAAEIASGEVFELEDGWSMTLPNDKVISDISIPYYIESRLGDTFTLTHPLTEEHASLALNFYAQNCAIRIFVDGKPIYEAGFTDSGNAPDIGKIGDADGEKKDEPMMVDTTSEREEAGEITADLPSTLSDGVIRIVLVKVNSDEGIYIHKAIVSKRDVVVINVLKESMIPILCAIFIVICGVIVLTLDVMRLISGEVTRGLVIISWLALNTCVFIILQTDLMKIFFANQYYFEKIAVMAVLVIPIMFSFFYYIGFKIHFPKTVSAMVWTNILLTFTVLILEMIGTELSSSLVKPLTGVLLVSEIAFIAVILVRWNKQSEGYKTIIYDMLSLFCFSSAGVLIMEGNLSEHGLNREIAIDIILTLGYVFITIQHISIVIANFKLNVEENNKILERQVKIAEDAKIEAIAASEAKGNFLANMSHEIRTPINAVLGMDEMILRESREKSIREYAMDIHTAGQSLLSIINDILDMSKIESGKMEIIPVEYDLSSLIHDLSNMISFRAKSKNLSLEVSVDNQLPAKVLGDDVRIKQVVTNILTNAVKYTESGTVWMRVTGSRKDDIETIKFEVEDTGIGIKEEDMSKLFEAFQRIEEGRNRNIEGTGLGMSITMQLLEMMGSKLEVESVYGKGSKFYFSIDQKIIDDTPLGDFETRIKGLESQYTYNRSFIAPDATILVVDDNVMNRKVFSALLKPTQINVVEAESGYESIEKCINQRFDIVFMDHMMPGMDGIEAFHKIRDEKESMNKDTPIIILTANAVAGAKEEYLKEGFDGFLSKPVVADKLEDMIREILPEEMLKEAPDDIGSTEEKQTAPIEELPAVDGVDWEVAWLHLSSMELMESAFTEFYNIINVHADKLQGFYDALPEELDNYRIQVHGMKSSAAAVGIIPLAGMAKILEFAAKDENIDIIHSMHNVFINEWRTYRKKLTGVFGLGEKDDGPKDEVDTNALKALLNSLTAAMEDMDIDAADDCVSKLKSLVMPDEAAALIETLQGQVSDLDSDGAIETINKMLDNL